MTRLTTKLMIAAAALVAAGAASAQTMKADIPFAFRAGGKVMAAGTYQMDFRGTGGTVTIRGLDRGAVFAKPITHTDGTVEAPKLVFACGRGTCSLSQAWPGYSGSGLVFDTPKVDPREESSLTEIRLRPAAAE
jgi:hypothetical protein